MEFVMPKDTKFTFKRYEKKYLLQNGKYVSFFEKLQPFIRPDEYFSSTVCSIYYDNADFRLIRASIEDPVYKEKLRLRSYNVPGPDDEVFIEIKKKYKGIVYKRRISMPERDAVKYLSGEIPAHEESQIMRETDWFLRRNKPEPKVFIACERFAYVAKDNPELRITFDRNIRWRETDLELTAGDYGELLLPEGDVLMEIKIPGVAPLWLAELLSSEGIYPGGFSKYGTCYKNNLIGRFLDCLP